MTDKKKSEEGHGGLRVSWTDGQEHFTTDMKGQGMVSLYSVITALDSSHNIMLHVKNRMYLNQKTFIFI